MDEHFLQWQLNHHHHCYRYHPSRCVLNAYTQKWQTIWEKWCEPVAASWWCGGSGGDWSCGVGGTTAWSHHILMSNMLLLPLPFHYMANVLLRSTFTKFDQWGVQLNDWANMWTIIRGTQHNKKTASFQLLFCLFVSGGGGDGAAKQTPLRLIVHFLSERF